MKEANMLALRHAALRVVGRSTKGDLEMARPKRIFERGLSDPGRSEMEKIRLSIQALPRKTRQQIAGTTRAVLSEIQDYRVRRDRAA